MREREPHTKNEVVRTYKRESARVRVLHREGERASERATERASERARERESARAREGEKATERESERERERERERENFVECIPSREWSMPANRR